MKAKLSCKTNSCFKMALKKKFIDIEIPILETSIEVLGTPENLNKKTIKLDLSRKLRGKGLEIVFKIYNKDSKLTAFPKQMILMKSYIRRMIRKRISYVEDSIQTHCEEGKIIIKPFLITRKRVSRAVRGNLRRTAHEFLLDFVKEKPYLEIIESILLGELQKTMLPKLKKIYPLSFCDIRVFETPEVDKIFEKHKPLEIKNKQDEIETTEEITKETNKILKQEKNKQEELEENKQEELEENKQEELEENKQEELEENKQEELEENKKIKEKKSSEKKSSKKE